MTRIPHLLLLLLTAGCAARTDAVGPAEGAAGEFQTRVERYMELREEAAEAVLPFSETSDPARIREAQQQLAARIRAARPNARQGDILSADIRVHFRELLAPELKGEQGRDVRARLQDDAPEPDAVRLEVNGAYPPGTPFPTTPAPLLMALPPLPRGLEYRVIGRDLVLLDQPANLIVDYMRNAIPKPSSAGSGRTGQVRSIGSVAWSAS